MEITGLNDFYVWLYDKDGKLITDSENGGLPTDGEKGKTYDPKTGQEVKGIYKVDLLSSYGATQANITGLAPTAQKVYGSNAVAEQHLGAVNPSIALGANDIPHRVYDILTGLVKDRFGGYGHKKNNMVMGGVVAHSHNENHDVDLYFGFPMGLFTPGELNMSTDTENPNVVHDALTLNAQARGTDMLLYEKFYSDETNFDFTKMMNYLTGVDLTDPTNKPGDDSSKQDSDKQSDTTGSNTQA